MTDTAQPPLTHEQVEELAGDLLRALTPHAGDPEAVSQVLHQWHDVLDWQGLALVCMAAVRDTFAACLIMTPPTDVPPGALTLVPPTDGGAA